MRGAPLLLLLLLLLQWSVGRVGRSCTADENGEGGGCEVARIGRGRAVAVGRSVRAA